MNLYQVKKILKSKVGKRAKIKCNLGRNKYETYNVIIDKLYANIFTTIEEKNNIKELRTFSYNDIIMHQIKIDFED